MSKPEPSDADAVFNALAAVEGLPRHLLQSPFWQMKGSRLPASLQDVIGALAEAAFTGCPGDERRWHAGAVMLGQTAAFRESASQTAPVAWENRIAAVEAEILASPEASEPAAAAAFRRAAARALSHLETVEPARRDAALRAYDELVALLHSPKPAVDGLPGLVRVLERLDMCSELSRRLRATANSENDRVRAFGSGRLLVLEAQDVPLNLVVDDLTGRSVDLGAMRGMIVLVQFWASWCSPCRAEIPHLRSLRDRYGDRGFRIVGVSLDRLADGESQQEGRARMAAFMQANAMDWPSDFSGLGWDSPSAARLGVRSLPSSLLLNQEGCVAASDLRGEELAARIEQLLA